MLLIKQSSDKKQAFPFLPLETYRFTDLKQQKILASFLMQTLKGLRQRTETNFAGTKVTFRILITQQKNQGF